MKIRTALISVSDKTGLEQFVTGLHHLGVRILSTGGTARQIRSFGVPVTEVAEYTGSPEILDGRVKTLHPKIHAGLLARRDKPEHMDQLRTGGIDPIDMVVVNLYPFEEVTEREGVAQEEAIENIDIGGPSMLRSAAKNFDAVAVVSDPARYEEILAEMKAHEGELSPQTLFRLALDVFRLTSYYDGKIAEYFAQTTEENTESFPPYLTFPVRKQQVLRYGENPHQKAALYSGKKTPSSLTAAKQLQGKELSFNNMLDLDAAIALVAEFSNPAAVILKHNNPCGAAVADTLCVAYQDALACDPLSAFGSIIGLNRTVDGKTASVISEGGFVECIIAPGYERDALSIFEKKKNVRVMEIASLALPDAGSTLKGIRGGILVQSANVKQAVEQDLTVVTKKKPTSREIASLLFGFSVVKHVRSNAIVLSSGTKTVGIGAGQMSRVDSVIIAIRKAGERTRGAVLASDAFFPKPDSIEEAHKAGITAIIQPGGSIADNDIIAACDTFGIAMVFAGIRHFRH